MSKDLASYCTFMHLQYQRKQLAYTYSHSVESGEYLPMIHSQAHMVMLRADIASSVESSSQSTASVQWHDSVAKTQIRLFPMTARQKEHQAWLHDGWLLFKLSPLCGHRIIFTSRCHFATMPPLSQLRQPFRSQVHLYLKQTIKQPVPRPGAAAVGANAFGLQPTSH